MSTIRVRRSGVYYFAAQVAAYIISILFTIYVARVLPAIDYGIYGYIGSLWMAADVFKSGFNFWASRMIARGRKCLKSLMIANLLLSIPIAAILIAIIIGQASLFGDAYLYILTVSAAYIVSSYIYSSIIRTTAMQRPQYLGIDPIVTSLIKASLGVALIYIAGITGLLATFVVSNIVVSIILYRPNRAELEEEVDLSLIKEWGKGAWYPILLSLSIVLITNIQLLVMGALGDIGGLPSYNMAYRASRLIQFSSALSIALVPALLKGGDPAENTYKVLDLTLLIAIPTTLGLAIYSDSVVYLFGWNKYVDARIPLAILSVSMFIYLLNIIGTRIIVGMEDIDKEYTIDINRLLRSEMMRLLIYIYISVAVSAILIIILYPILGIIGMALSHLGATSTMFLLIGIKMLSVVDAKKLFSRVAKYLSASLLSIALIYPIPKYRSLYIGLAAISAMAIYIIVIYSIDKEVRELTKNILRRYVGIKLG